MTVLDRSIKAEFSRAEFSRHVGAIYDCAIDPSKWEPTLATIAAALDCHTSALSLVDVQQSRLLLNKMTGVEPFWAEQIPKHLEEINDVLARALANWPSLDDPWVISRQLRPAEIEASPYIQGVLKPQGLVDILQYFLLGNAARFAGFALGRHERQGIITDREIELGGLLLPHIRRAVTIGDLLDVRAIERSRVAETLDALRCAVVLTDPQGAILHANRSAEEMLREGRVVRDVGGVVTAKSRLAARQLLDAIALAAKDETEIGRAGLAVRLTPADASPLFATVLPLAGSDLRTRLVPAAVAAVFIGLPADHRHGAAVVAAAFGLTPAETRVLASLLGGLTIAEAARDLGIARTTARSHLEHIFGKTGVTRQAELIRLAAQLIPPTASPASD